MWGSQLTPFSNAGYFCILPDMRGHGGSSAIPARGFTIAHWAEELELLRTHFGLSSFHAAGVSMGGIVAGEYACRHPQRLRSLTLCDSFGSLPGFKGKALAAATLWGFRLLRLLPEGKSEQLFAGAYQFPGGEAAAEYFRSMIREANFTQLLRSRKVLYQVDTEPRLARYRGPALVMVGTRPGKFFIDLSRRLAGRLGTEAVLLEGALDPSNLTAAEEFNRELLAFLRHAGDERQREQPAAQAGGTAGEREA
jgi:3-oxoadipate enol-lactonase